MPEYVYALFDFVPENPDEIYFKAGDRIEVVEKDDVYSDGWWQVSLFDRLDLPVRCWDIVLGFAFGGHQCTGRRRVVNIWRGCRASCFTVAPPPSANMRGCGSV